MKGEAVAGRHEVNRRSHQLRPDRVAFGDQAAQLAGIEVVDSRPERYVGVLRLLRLHTHEPLDHVDGRRVGTRQQPLPLQQCAVQGARE